MAFLKRIGSVAACALAFAGVGAIAFRAASTTAAAAPAPLVSTQAVYAAFTLNLTRFVTWPDALFTEPTSALVIGTFPRDLINEHLDAIAAKETFNGRPIRTLRLQSLDDVAKCHVVFVSGNNPRQAAVLERAAGKPILTIGDSDGFLALGGHVRFIPQPPHTRLRISVPNLRASGLTGRSQLLRLAAQ